jgi:hypothetical protein
VVPRACPWVSTFILSSPGQRGTDTTIKEKCMRESGVTQASQRISIRLREDENLRKAVKVIEKRFLCEMGRLDPSFMSSWFWKYIPSIFSQAMKMKKDIRSNY